MDETLNTYIEEWCTGFDAGNEEGTSLSLRHDVRRLELGRAWTQLASQHCEGLMMKEGHRNQRKLV